MFETGEALLEFISEKKVEFVDIRFTDIHGRWQHFSIPASEINHEVFKEGVGFDWSSIQGFTTIQESDLLLFLDPATAFLDQFSKDKTLNIISDIADPLKNTSYDKDPRGVAKRAETYLKKSGLADTCYIGPEAEFFIFDSVSFSTDPYSYGFSFTAMDAHTDGERESDGYWIKNKSGYFPVPPSDKYQDIRSLMVKNLVEAGIEVEKHHHEVATAGQSEIDIRYDGLLNMADKLVKFKYIIRNTAITQEKTVTFMPKPIYGDNGSGMHVHMSLWKGDTSIMYEKGGYADLSAVAMQFIAGILDHAPALAALTNPAVNSYRRLVKGFEAPVNLIVSASNRSAIIRIPGYAATPKSKHFEYRGPDPLANPYLAFSGLLMAGIDGVKKKMGPPPTTDKNLFELPDQELVKIRTLPESLADSLNALIADHDFLLEGGVFTQELLDSYIDLKRAEVDLVRQHPNPTEFDLYFDL
jgi:glutamine synthetase